MMTGVALVAADIGDPDSTRTVIAIIALLVVVGLALVMLAFWLRRTTRPDPEFLAPLEVMGERSWRRGDPVWQRRRLDEVRPDGAVPLKKAALPPRLDESFDAGPSGSGFDDLRPDQEPVAAAAVASGEQPAVDDTTVALTPEPADVETADASVPADAVTVESADDAVNDDAVDTSATHEASTDASHADEASAVDEDDRTVEGGGNDREPGQQRSGDQEHDDAEDMRTPIGSPRPSFDELPEHDIDPALLEQAMAELDAELQRGGNDA